MITIAAMIAIVACDAESPVSKSRPSIATTPPPAASELVKDGRGRVFKSVPKRSSIGEIAAVHLWSRLSIGSMSRDQRVLEGLDGGCTPAGLMTALGDG